MFGWLRRERKVQYDPALDAEAIRNMAPSPEENKMAMALQEAEMYREAYERAVQERNEQRELVRQWTARCQQVNTELWDLRGQRDRERPLRVIHPDAQAAL